MYATAATGILQVWVRAYYRYGYGHAIGMDTGVRAGVDVNVFMECTVCRGTHTEHLHECCIQPPSIITSLCEHVQTHKQVPLYH